MKIGDKFLEHCKDEKTKNERTLSAWKNENR